MPRIELAWDHDCPHVESARASLSSALRQLGMLPVWREWRRDDPAAPEHARRAGSPAILVDGRAVGLHVLDVAACCRVYVDARGRRSGAPTVESIMRALAAASRSG